MRRRALVHRWFDESLSVRQTDRLFEQVKTDPEARKELESLLAIEAMISGSGDPRESLCHFERDRIERYVIAKTLERSPSILGRRLSWKMLAFAVPAMVLLLALPLAWFLMGRVPTAPDTGVIEKSMFAPRGVQAPYETHLFLFCVEGEGENAVVRRLDRPAAMSSQADTCAMAGELQFALTNLTDNYPFLYVFGLDKKGRRLWYLPTPRKKRSLAIPTGIREALLGESIILHVNHRPGRARVFAVFSKTPLSENDITPALETLRTDPMFLRLRIDKSDVLVESFAIRIGSGGDAP
jgi:hypothetical protein